MQVNRISGVINPQEIVTIVLEPEENNGKNTRKNPKRYTTSLDHPRSSSALKNIPVTAEKTK